MDHSASRELLGATAESPRDCQNQWEGFGLGAQWVCLGMSLVDRGDNLSDSI